MHRSRAQVRVHNVGLPAVSQSPSAVGWPAWACASPNVAQSSSFFPLPGVDDGLFNPRGGPLGCHADSFAAHVAGAHAEASLLKAGHGRPGGCPAEFHRAVIPSGLDPWAGFRGRYFFAKVIGAMFPIQNFSHSSFFTRTHSLVGFWRAKETGKVGWRFPVRASNQEVGWRFPVRASNQDRTREHDAIACTQVHLHSTHARTSARSQAHLHTWISYWMLPTGPSHSWMCVGQWIEAKNMNTALTQTMQKPKKASTFWFVPMFPYQCSCHEGIITHTHTRTHTHTHTYARAHTHAHTNMSRGHAHAHAGPSLPP